MSIQLCKMEFNVSDDEGNPVSGVSIEVRKQGAQVRGAIGGSPYTVDHSGAIATGNTVKLYYPVLQSESSTASATVSSETQIATTGDLGAASDDDRLTVSSPLPTIYEDIIGNASTSNPLTTDAEGHAECYVTGGMYDVLRSGGGLSTRLYTDVPATGGGRTKVNLFDNGSAVGYEWDTSPITVAGAKNTRFLNAGVEIASVDKAGKITAAGGLVATTGGVTATAGGLVVSASGASIVGNSSITGTLGVSSTLTAAGITSSNGLTVSGGTVSLPAGEIGTTELAANAVTVPATINGNTDYAMATSYTTIPNCSITQNIDTTSSYILLIGKLCVRISNGALGALRTFDFKLVEDPAGTPVVLDEQRVTLASGTADESYFVVNLSALRTGVSGSHTYVIQAMASSIAESPLIESSTTDRKARLHLIEFKR